MSSTSFGRQSGALDTIAKTSATLGIAAIDVPNITSGSWRQRSKPAAPPSIRCAQSTLWTARSLLYPRGIDLQAVPIPQEANASRLYRVPRGGRLHLWWRAGCYC